MSCILQLGRQDILWFGAVLPHEWPTRAALTRSAGREEHSQGLMEESKGYPPSHYRQTCVAVQRA